MIHELRTYTFVPGKLGEAMRLSGDVSRRTRGDDYGKLEGYWVTEFGTLNQVVHIWSYADLSERTRLRAALMQNQAWRNEFLVHFLPLVVTQENRILAPALPLTPPAGEGHVYELRTYRTRPGRAGEVVDLYKEIMPLRERYSKIVGLWTTEIAQLNEVCHLWAYRDLNERAAVRARVQQEPEWQRFLGRLLPLLQEMRSVVLTPLAFSPMR